MCNPLQLSSFVFFFNATATSDIYTLSLHDALPICHAAADERQVAQGVERYEVDDRQRGLQRVIATPPHATAMPSTVSQPGATPNSASSSATANTGGRYIMLVTRAAPPWRSSQYRTITPRIEAKITRNAIAAAISHAQIGRASCRERVEIWVGSGSSKQK